MGNPKGCDVQAPPSESIPGALELNHHRQTQIDGAARQRSGRTAVYAVGSQKVVSVGRQHDRRGLTPLQAVLFDLGAAQSTRTKSATCRGGHYSRIPASNTGGALREPLESGVVSVSRAALQTQYPAAFQLRTLRWIAGAVLTGREETFWTGQ